MAGNQILGRGVVKVDGVPLANDVDFTLDLGGTKRTSETDAIGNVYFKESTDPAKLDFNLLVNPGTSLKAIQAYKNNTVSVEADTGQTWTIPGAFSADVPSIAGSNGRAKIVFMGNEAQEIIV